MTVVMMLRVVDGPEEADEDVRRPPVRSLITARENKLGGHDVLRARVMRLLSNINDYSNLLTLPFKDANGKVV